VQRTVIDSLIYMFRKEFLVGSGGGNRRRGRAERGGY
jgi:hypothetical protein